MGNFAFLISVKAQLVIIGNFYTNGIIETNILFHLCIDSVMYITTPVTCWVNCIAFSPANKVHVAIAGKHGTELVDLRKPVG